jgi:hypothetical protein
VVLSQLLLVEIGAVLEVRVWDVIPVLLLPVGAVVVGATELELLELTAVDVVDATELEVVEVTAVELVEATELDVVEAVEDVLVVVVWGLPQSPSRAGTASGPLPMATREEPQSSLLATWMLRLSWS